MAFLYSEISRDHFLFLLYPEMGVVFCVALEDPLIFFFVAPEDPLNQGPTVRKSASGMCMRMYTYTYICIHIHRLAETARMRHRMPVGAFTLK